MIIKGNEGYLSEDEQELTGLQSPTDLCSIDVGYLLLQLSIRQNRLEALQVDVGLTHTQLDPTLEETLKLVFDRHTIEKIAGQLLVHQAQASIQNL